MFVFRSKRLVDIYICCLAQHSDDSVVQVVVEARVSLLWWSKIVKTSVVFCREKENWRVSSGIFW